jgi:enoyl-CoA hydratase/carnithine racemase
MWEKLMTQTIVFEEFDGIARLGFNRAAQHNALGKMELAGIESALKNLSADTRVLMIYSEGGRTFCAGADLGQISSGELTGDQFQAVTNQIADLSIPTICVANGNIFGGGVELAMSCDFRMAADDILMRVPAAAIGLCYPTDGIERFVSRLGVTVAKRILVGAEELSADEMKALRIVDWTASASGIMEAALDVANALASLAPLAVSAMLEIIKQAEAGSIDRVRAAQLTEMCGGSEDLKEGLLAKRERRAPRFLGH